LTIINSHKRRRRKPKTDDNWLRIYKHVFFLI
jgi:hypothetical protein